MTPPAFGHLSRYYQTLPPCGQDLQETYLSLAAWTRTADEAKREEDVTYGGQPTPGAVQEVCCSPACIVIDLLSKGNDRQITETIVVKIAGGEGKAEGVICFRDVWDVWAILVKQLGIGSFQAFCRTV
jgi:hypothetical protein